MTNRTEQETTMQLPHMTIDPNRPGVIIFDGDFTAGMLAGMRAKIIAEACNAYAVNQEELTRLRARAEEAERDKANNTAKINLIVAKHVLAAEARAAALKAERDEARKDRDEYRRKYSLLLYSRSGT